MFYYSGVFIPDDENYNHILCIYVQSLHIFFEKNKLFGKDYPIYYDGKYFDILKKYSKNIISTFKVESLKNVKKIEYVEESLNSELNLKVRNFLMDGIELKNKNKIIFIKRKNRKISNSSQIIDFIEKNDEFVEEIDFETLSFDEQIKLSNETKMMIGVHGAGLTNLMFMEKNAFVLELDFFNWGFNCYEHLANNLKMKNYFRFCEEKTKNKHVNDLEIDFFKFERKMKNILEMFKQTVIL